MTIRFFNTLTREKEDFQPNEDLQVRMYTCGPTVYDCAHIGNWRTYLFEDILRRHLEYRGFDVTQVMNITDVDDKTIRGAMSGGISLDAYTGPFTEAFFEDRDALNVKPAHVYPRATQHIPEMVALIKTLLDKGVAYSAEDGSTYYDITKFPGYGKLSHFRIEELKAGARVKSDEYEKAQVSDFALWKAWDEADGAVFWETELGKGRPGWHIECSAMSMKYLGQTFDIHTGGVDNIFPHHENEIAQSEAATGRRFVNYWLHSEHLLVEGRKMSKSFGNFYTLRDVIARGYDPTAFRYLVLGAHYRSKLNFTWRALETAKTTLENLYEFVGRLDKESSSGLEEAVQRAATAFGEAMDDDLNTPVALAAVFGLIKEVNIHGRGGREVFEAMVDFDRVLGLELAERAKPVSAEIPREILGLVQEREKARKARDFATADRIRSELAAAGYLIEDTPEGPRVKAK
ncbi:MAG TPA: cysteine--tRNA ligase [Armatimonadota bacterium]|nr:cysteine--tRNA ligase [Armatimonadota bacterium]